MVWAKVSTKDTNNQRGSECVNGYYHTNYFLKNQSVITNTARSNHSKISTHYTKECLLRFDIRQQHTSKYASRFINKTNGYSNKLISIKCTHSNDYRIKHLYIDKVFFIYQLIRELQIIERKRLQWYGQVKRMQEERLPKLIMEWIPGERRKRGRPRKTWMEGVRAAMKTRHLEADRWLSRKEWCLGSARRRQLSQDLKDR